MSGDGALPGRPNSFGSIMVPPEQEIDLDHRLIDCRRSCTHLTQAVRPALDALTQMRREAQPAQAGCHYAARQ